MPEKVKLTKVFRKQKVSKNGKMYNSISIKTDEYGDQLLGGFGNNENNKWKEGDVVEITVTKNGEYMNFENEHTRTSKNEDVLEALRQLYSFVEEMHNEIMTALGRPEKIKPKDKLPF